MSLYSHFFSPNPFENGKPRATWQSSFDTSAVWGKVIVSTNDPNIVASGAFPGCWRKSWEHNAGRRKARRSR